MFKSSEAVEKGICEFHREGVPSSLEQILSLYTNYLPDNKSVFGAEVVV